MGLLHQGKGDAELIGQYLRKANCKVNPEEEDQDAAIIRCHVFGTSVWSSGMSSLIWAIEASNLKLVEVLLETYPTLLEKGDQEGLRPLHYASLNGQGSIATLLLDRGAHVHSCDQANGETPLHLAAMNGHTELVKLLLRRGANPNALSFNNTTPLHYAVMNAHTRLITLLLSCPDIDVSLKNKEGLTAKDLAHRSATTQLKDYFNEQKRKHLVALSSLGEEKQQLEERFLQASAELEKTSQAQRIALEKLEAEDKLYMQTLSRLVVLRKESEEMDVCRDDNSWKEEYELLKSELARIKVQNREREQELLAKDLERQLERDKFADKITDAHQSLGNVMSLMDTANIAIINLKSTIESSKNLLHPAGK